MTPWTRTPNVVIDRLMPDLKDTEVRVLLVVLRSTVGWNRDQHSVILSYSMLAQRTGRSSEAISNALKGLERKGLIHIARGKRSRSRQIPKTIASDSEGH